MRHVRFFTIGRVVSVTASAPLLILGVHDGGKPARSVDIFLNYTRVSLDSNNPSPDGQFGATICGTVTNTGAEDAINVSATSVASLMIWQ